MRTAADRPPSPAGPRHERRSDDRRGPEEPLAARRAPGTACAAARGFAACAGSYVGANLLVALLDGGADANHDWLDLRGLPRALSVAVEALACASLLDLATRPSAGARSARPRELGLAGIALACLGVAAVELGESAGAALRPLLAAAAFAALRFASRCGALVPVDAHSGGPGARASRTAAALGALLFAVGAPLAAIAACSPGARGLAPTADAARGIAVVFGAGVSVDGVPSLALADRVRTAAALHRDGRVHELWCSGGPGPGAVHETEAMQRLALELGVPGERVRRDLGGLSTWATAERTAAWARAAPNAAPRVFAVSHGYHLARVELAFQRHGLAVHTVPALETRPLARLPWYVAREVGGYWVYWTRRARLAVARPEAILVAARAGREAARDAARPRGDAASALAVFPPRSPFPPTLPRRP